MLNTFHLMVLKVSWMNKLARFSFPTEFMYLLTWLVWLINISYQSNLIVVLFMFFYLMHLYLDFYKIFKLIVKEVIVIGKLQTSWQESTAA